MAQRNNTKIIIWILIGSCILNLIFAINAGQKRKVAVSKAGNLDAKLAEIELRYKNAVQSYDAVEKSLQDTRKDLKEQQIFADTLKEALKEEQKKSVALRDELEKTKSLLNKTGDKPIAETPKKALAPAVKITPKIQDKKIDRTNKVW